MHVYAFWDATEFAPARQAELVAAFHRACLIAGDTPRLLTARDALKSRRYREALATTASTGAASLPMWALRAKRGKRLVSLAAYENLLP